jgi:hypothetical protein
MFVEIQTGLSRDAVHARGCVRLFTLFVGILIAVNYVPVGYAIGAAFVFLLGWELVDQRARTKQMRQFAERAGFTYIGSALPKSLFLQGAPSLRNAHSAKRVVAGETARREFVVFDCTLGHGKGAKSRTVLAVRGQFENLGAALLGPDQVEQVGEWIVLRSSDYLLPVEEIEEILSDIR